MNCKKAVVLLSGGLDSATTLAIARDEGYACYALSFRYGQRHAVELETAASLGRHFDAVKHEFVDVDLRLWGGSALTDDIDVPHGGNPDEAAIPVTYVPARNIIFLSFAVAWAEVLDAEAIFIGVNALDYSGYPDCRPEFIDSFSGMINMGTKAGVEGHAPEIRAPLIALTKKEIIEKGTALGVNYGLTFSCYDPTPEGSPCGTCDSCILRARGFAEAGLQDPLLQIKN